MPVGGVVYILGHATGSQERHISSIHTSIAIFEFGNEFDKMPILRHFHHFSHHQKSPLSHQKSPQTLENKAFSRNHPKISYLTTKQPLTNHQKSNHKISKTPVKSILLLSNTN